MVNNNGKICKNCGILNEADAIFCGGCGYNLKMQKEDEKSPKSQDNDGKKTLLLHGNQQLLEEFEKLKNQIENSQPDTNDKKDNAIIQNTKENEEKIKKPEPISPKGTLFGIAAPMVAINKIDNSSKKNVDKPDSKGASIDSSTDELKTLMFNDPKKTIIDSTPAYMKFFPESEKKINETSKPNEQEQVSGRTMLGVPIANVLPPQNVEQNYSVSDADNDESNGKGLNIQNRNWSLWIGIFSIFLLVILISSIYYFFFRGVSQFPLQASVSLSNETQELTINISFTDDVSSKINYIETNNQNIKVVNGKSSIKLEASKLKIGENIYPLKIVTKDGTIINQNVSLILTHQIKADLKGLSQDAPFYSLIFNVQPGSTIIINDQKIKVDKNQYDYKVFLKNISKDILNKKDFISNKIDFTIITPQGNSVNDSIVINLPITYNKLILPNNGALTDKNQIIIWGKAKPGTQITIKNNKIRNIALINNEFRDIIELEKLGKNIISVYFKKDNEIPSEEEIEIIKVNSINDLIKEIQPKLNKININKLYPMDNTLLGNTIGFEGKIIASNFYDANIELEIIITNHTCTKIEGCPVLIDYNSTEVYSIGEKVRVYGKIIGQKEVLTQTKTKLSLPLIEGIYIQKI